MSRKEAEPLEQRIREALDDLRPFLAADGGDITLDEVTADGIARVRLHGACCGCAMSPMTMKAGVEEAIKRVAPSIRSVEAVNMGRWCDAPFPSVPGLGLVSGDCFNTLVSESLRVAFGLGNAFLWQWAKPSPYQYQVKGH
ncbi:MAG: NifU family protein [Flavobacteriales bacterium]|nr:NifU family protein [Flavobacteriales bacterium]